ncbi:MAG: threonylcarbamoyl-AMP synthase [Cytophagales bacterium]|nr:threonylcarbamoyl-AMP synthase [Cytophagales bacterium]
MPASFIKLYQENPDPNKIRKIADVLRQGGVVIYPTDTIYGIGCDIFNRKAVERVARIKGGKADKANFSFICHDISEISQYAKQIHTPVYKLLRRALPGPFTFIFKASSKVPKALFLKKKTVGLRVPAHSVPVEIVRELGNPIITTSIRDEDEVLEYSTDPELIYEKYKHKVDIVIDGGYGANVASTVVDCTDDQIEVVREGLGNIEKYL